MIMLPIHSLVKFSHQKYAEVLIISLSTFLALFTRILTVNEKWMIQTDSTTVSVLFLLLYV